jgi:hypothetical protein
MQPQNGEEKPGIFAFLVEIGTFFATSFIPFHSYAVMAMGSQPGL